MRPHNYSDSLSMVFWGNLRYGYRWAVTVVLVHAAQEYAETTVQRNEQRIRRACKHLAMALRAEAVPAPCAWREDADGNWEAACGETWVLLDGGTPAEHHYRFCPGCGQPIGAVPYAVEATA